MDIGGLIPAFGSAAYTIIFFVIALSIIVAVHEFGHYIVGRWSGIHAEVFSLGFGPVLWSRNDRRGTKWQIAALPFGGYVKFLGDSDAASGKDGEVMAGLSADERRRSMHGAPLWARAATVAAGPFFNFALSIIIFAAIILIKGIAMEPPTIGVLKPLPQSTAGLQSGDTILSVAGIALPDYAALDETLPKIPSEVTLDYTIRRDGQEMTVQGPYPFPPRVEGLMPGQVADQAGIKKGDVVTHIDGKPIASFSQLQKATLAAADKAMKLTIWRPGTTLGSGETMDIEIAPRIADAPTDDGGFETKRMLGIYGTLAFDPATRSAGLGEAVSGAARDTWGVARTSLSALYHMVAGRISQCNLSGPIRMAGVVGDAARGGVEQFFLTLAGISTAIGFLNLFPIPVLDGGHLVFHAYEAIFRRPPNERALRLLMSVGLALILSLMVFALTMDVFCP